MKRFSSLLMVFLGLTVSCQENTPETPAPPAPVPPYAWTDFSMGADLSYLNELEDYGAVYLDSSKVQDPFVILKSHGLNTVRVRLWNNPQWVGGLTGGKIYSDLADAEKTISRAKALGMAVNLDFHYSDEWADAGHQSVPAAWEGLSLDVLKDSVYAYTLSVLQYLEAKGLTPEMVQIGNETNNGMLWPVGKVQNDDWQPFGALLNAGIKAVRDFSAGSSVKPRIILHVAQLQNADWWIQGIMNKGGVTDFDIIGLSHYAKWSTVTGMSQITSMVRNMVTIRRKQVMIVETAYPWTAADADGYTNIISGGDTVPGYPATPASQLQYLKNLTQAVIAGGGSGIMYWEPEWITSPMPDKWGTGSPWDNCTWFDFSGNPVPAMNFMNYPYVF